MILGILIQKEARELLTTAKFSTTFAVCSVLILLAFYVGGTKHTQAVSQWEASKAENVRQVEGLTDWMEVRSQRIFLPPNPLEALVTGISSDIGRTADVRTYGEIAPEDSRYNEDPIFAVFRFLDLNFIFQIVLSLFAILLGYDAISGEKEQGTLSLTFANAVPRSTYILAKLLGSFGTLTVALIIPMSLGALLLPALGVHLSPDDWIRLGLVLFTGMLYFSAFLALSIFVSSLTHRTSSSFLILLVIWIGSALIIPRAAVLLAGRAVDVPSVDEISDQKATYARQLGKEYINGMAGFRVPEGIAKDDIQATLQAFNACMDSLGEIRSAKMGAFRGRLNEDRQNRQRAQTRAAFALARISPTASLALATSALAGTSVRLKDQFYDEATNYRSTFTKFLTEKTGTNIGGRMIAWHTSDSDDEEDPEPIDIQEIPTFEFRNASLAESIEMALFDMGLLGLFTILFYAGAFFAFLRYDLR